MNLLINNAPDYITVGGNKIEIKTDFALWVKLLLAIDSQDMNQLAEAFQGIFAVPPKNVDSDELMTAIKDWLSLSNESTSGGGETNTANKTAFDFEADGSVIFCELWEHFPHLMEKGISFHVGIELIKLLMSNDKTVMYHRAFARCGDFSKLSKSEKEYWGRERAKYAIKAKQEDIDDVFSRAF